MRATAFEICASTGFPCLRKWQGRISPRLLDAASVAELAGAQRLALRLDPACLSPPAAHLALLPLNDKAMTMCARQPNLLGPHNASC
jgi:hypothetical protein